MGNRKIAIPEKNHKLANHFAQCQQISIYKIDGGKITGKKEVQATQESMQQFPALIYNNGVDVVLAAGIEDNTFNALTGLGITVLAGTTKAPADKLINDYIKGKLKTKFNT